MQFGDQSHRSEVRDALRVYARDRELRRLFDSRGAWLLPFAVDEALQRGLPAELAFLPIVESRLNPTASQSGNVGLWQFQGATARLLGLQTGPGIDERKDPVLSTRAAYSYLSRLHRLFDGDWMLALAAYNIGDGRLRQLLRGSRHRSVWDLPLPAHTRIHLARLAALWTIARDPAAAGLQLPSVPARVTVARVRLDANTDALDLAQQHGADPDAIRLFNAHLGSGPWRAGATVWLPSLGAVQAVAADTVAAPVATGGVTGAVDRYRVTTGDSLWRIAQRFGVRIGDLRSHNGLRSDALRVGDELVIPPDR